MIVFLCVVALAAGEPLREALQSSEALVKLFNDFSVMENRAYSASEARFRLRLFKKTLQSVVETNEADLGWTAGLNFFSDLTEEEKAQYLGLNTSLHLAPAPAMPETQAPSSIDWRSQGAVTGVKNQGKCGSCWTFGAVGSTEGVHKKTTGSLVTFAEQELLDCVYEGRRDGCQGGWMQDGFTYIQQHQRLAPSSAVSYRGSDGACNYNGKANGLRAKVTGQYGVPGSESGHTSGLSRGPIAVAFEVTNKCQQYRGGIFKDTTCSGSANHAVTMVGFDSQKFMIKNSWGGGWGSGGYIYMARNHHNCQLYSHSAVITMSGSGPDPRPTDGPNPDPDCRDAGGQMCQLYRDWMCRYQPHNCMKTCGRC
jgi:C1A family cysteine protease